MSTTILYVHGANSSPVTFNYLRSQIPADRALDIAYDGVEPAMSVVARVVALCEAAGGDVTVIGHSLGGVIALSASRRTTAITRVATLASPVGGWRLATYLRWISPARIFEDIHPNSALIRSVVTGGFAVPVLSLITTRGNNPLLGEPNDGVVSIASQRAIASVVQVDIPTNHFEISLSPLTVSHLTQFIST